MKVFERHGRKLELAEDQWIDAGEVEEQEKGENEGEREKEELVDDHFLVVQMHENQGDEGGLDGR